MEKILHFTLPAKCYVFHGDLISPFRVKHFLCDLFLRWKTIFLLTEFLKLIS